MKLPKNYFESLSITKYREYLKLLPTIKQENTKIITMLIFTFVSLSFLGLFAINPTLSTIIELQKQLDESKLVYQQLQTKKNNLSYLQQQYADLSDQFSYVYAAIPENASIPTLTGQISTLAQRSNITIVSLNISPVVLIDSKLNNTFKSHTSFTFTVEAEGSYQEIMQFTSYLSNFDRIVTIESIALIKNSQNDKLFVTIDGREYFKK